MQSRAQCLRREHSVGAETDGRIPVRHVLVSYGGEMMNPGGSARLRMVAACALCVVLVFLSLTALCTAAGPPRKVSLQLRWDYQYQFAGYLAADWKGYYAEEGLEADIRSAIIAGGQILSAVEEVGAGRADFGVGAADVLIARDRGVPLVLLATIFQQSSSAFYSLPSAGVSSLADFTRLRVARKVGDLIDVEMQVMLRAEGIDPETVRAYPHEMGAAHLLEGRVDIMPGYSFALPYSLRKVGIEPHVISARSYGIDFYGDSLFAREDLVRREPELVERFIRASLRGWEYALSNPEETARMISDLYPGRRPKEEVLAANLYQTDAVRELALFPDVGVGHGNPHRWERMHEHLLAAGLVRKPFDPALLLEHIQAEEAEAARKRNRILATLAAGLGALTLVALTVVSLLNRAFRKRTAELEREALRREGAEAGLQQREELYRLIAENSSDSIWAMDADRCFTYLSPSTARIFGYGMGELVGMSWKEVVAPGYVAPLSDKLDSLCASPGSEGLKADIRVRHKDGHEMWAEVCASAVWTADGRLRGIVGVSRDITEKERIIQALNASERMHRTLVDSMPDIVMRFDPAARHIFVSPNVTRVIDMEPERFLGRTHRELGFAENFCDEVESAIRRVVDTGEPQEQEIRVLGRSGWFVFDWRLVPEEDEAHGRVQSVLSIARDVTDQRRMERDYENLFQQMMEGFALHEIICDEEGIPVDYRFLSVNSAFERMTGLCGERVVGRTVLEVLPDTEPYWIETYGKVALTGQAASFENYSSAIDRYFEVKAFSPELGVFACIFSDITERVHGQHALLLAKEQAEEASKVKSQFLANMSHELRTPLNGIMGMLQVLEDTSLDGTQVVYVDMALQSCRRITRLLGDILDISKIESGMMELVCEPFSVPEIMATVQNLFNVSAVSGNVRLSVRVGDDVPETVRGDASRLLQVLNNLVGNAIKFTADGSVDLDVSLLFPPAPGTVRLLFTVTDTGVGIPEEMQNRVFEPFTQADGGITRRYEGAGLGLSIVRRIVERMGGNISIDSEAGGGTTVCVAVPFSMPEPLVASPGKVTFASALPGQTRALRILLAEDDPVNRMAATRFMEKLGHTVHVAENGMEVLGSLRQARYDVIFMDIQMPFMDGLEATRVIRQGGAGEENTGVPIIALTAYAMVGDAQRFLQSGMNAYLAKPLDFSALSHVLAGLNGEAPE